MYLKVHYSVGENTWSVNIVKANNILEAKKQIQPKGELIEEFVKINGKSFSEFKKSNCEEDIEWISYASYECLKHIYVYIGNGAVNDIKFDVWYKNAEGGIVPFMKWCSIEDITEQNFKARAAELNNANILHDIMSDI